MRALAICTPENSIETAKALAELAEYLRLEHPDPKFAPIGEAIGEYLKTGAGRSLDDFLGLRSHGGVTVQRAMAINNRDRLLRHLANTLPEWNGKEPRHVAREMRKAFERYESGRWLRERNNLAAPSAEPYATFWRVLIGNVSMPQLRRLREILENGNSSAV